MKHPRKRTEAKRSEEGEEEDQQISSYVKEEMKNIHQQEQRVMRR
jgi:hypothetical protein